MPLYQLGRNFDLYQGTVTIINRKQYPDPIFPRRKSNPHKNIKAVDKLEVLKNL